MFLDAWSSSDEPKLQHFNTQHQSKVYYSAVKMNCGSVGQSWNTFDGKMEKHNKPSGPVEIPAALCSRQLCC